MALAEQTNSAIARQGSVRSAAVSKTGSVRQTTGALFVAADLAVIWLSSLAALTLRFTPELARRFGLSPLHRHAHLLGHIGFLALYSVLVVLFCSAQGLYRSLPTFSPAQETRGVTKAAVFATGLETVCIALAGISFISRFVIGYNLVASAVLLAGWRRLRRLHLAKTFANGWSRRSILIVGTDAQAQAFRIHLERNRHLGYVVSGFITESESPDAGSAEVLGSISDLRAIARSHFVDEVFVSATNRETVKRTVFEAGGIGLDVRVIPDLYDGLGWGAPVEYIGRFPVMALYQRSRPAAGLMVKRCVDVVVSAGALAVLSPLFLLLALAVKLSSPGPVIYTSERVGRKGRTFLCHKFRTMQADADALKSSLQHLNQRDRVLFKLAHDPRVTRIGRFLRKYSLDELPQLWNVLKGEMSLVGPRPPLASEIQHYELQHLRRLDMLPGITGLWQVEARNNPSFARYVALDVDYVENWSPWLDTVILLKTIAVVLAGTGE